jgi:hypothetical protein
VDDAVEQPDALWQFSEVCQIHIPEKQRDDKNTSQSATSPTRDFYASGIQYLTHRDRHEIHHDQRGDVRHDQASRELTHRQPEVWADLILFRMASETVRILKKKRRRRAGIER